jgi:hypothetical protein
VISQVFVYVEGPSDQRALETLLQPLLERKKRDGTDVRFLTIQPGRNKGEIVEKGPRKAAQMLVHRPDVVVALMPDLHPRNCGFPHETAEELIEGLTERFDAALERMGRADEDTRARFGAFCAKHDLEALLLASPEPLARRLGATKLKCAWRVPVEDHNHTDPPKRVVERLFAQHDREYVGTVDAPMILRAMDYAEVAKRCDQCFAPFVEFLQRA